MCVYLLFYSWRSVEAVCLFGLNASHVTQRLQTVLDCFTALDKCHKYTFLNCGASSNWYISWKIELLISLASLWCDPVTDNREGQITNSRCPCGSIVNPLMWSTHVQLACVLVCAVQVYLFLDHHNPCQGTSGFIPWLPLWSENPPKTNWKQ